MRHVWSLLLGLVVAPLAWLMMSIGQLSTGKEFDTYTNKGVFTAGDFVRPLAMLALAGLLLGVLACLRISPVGPLVVGLGYLATFAGLAVVPHRTYDLFAYTFRLSFLHGQGKGDLSTPLTTGTAPVIGALLVVAVVSAKRWRQWPKTVGAHSIAAQDLGVRPATPTGYDEPVNPAPAWTSTGSLATPAETTLREPALVPAEAADPLPVRTVPRQTTPDTAPDVTGPGHGEPSYSEPSYSTPSYREPSYSESGHPAPSEPEPAGTVVWTREPAADQTTDSLSAAGRARSPWDTPPGDADGSQTR